MRYVLTGGGSGGPTMPLIAIGQALRKQDPKAGFFFIGSKQGPERHIAEVYKLPFYEIPAARLRRYPSLQTLVEPFVFFAALFEALRVLPNLKPDAILSAGSFVSVPVVWAGFLLRIPCFTHQQDIEPGLANKLMVPFVKKITATLPESQNDFPTKKVVLTGNPVREEIYHGTKEKAVEIFKLNESLPTVLVIGGGTGAMGLNTFVEEAATELGKLCNIIHLTGGKTTLDQEAQAALPNYHPFTFLDTELPHAFAAATIVVARAGFSTLTELAVLGKPTIVVPMPGSHQELNAQYFLEKEAVEVLPEEGLSAGLLTQKVSEILANEGHRQKLSRNISSVMPQDGATRVARVIIDRLKNHGD